MNVNETNSAARSAQVNGQEKEPQKTEQKQQNPPSVWLHDNGDGYFQVTDLAGIVEENEITNFNGTTRKEKTDVRREFVKEFALHLQECINKPLAEVQTKIQGYIDTFLEKRAEAKAKEAEEQQRRKAADDLLGQLDEEKPKEAPNEKEPSFAINFPNLEIPSDEKPQKDIKWY